jgi:multidrug resistance efflux pump
MRAIIFIITAVFLYSYSAKVEPFEVYKIKSAVNGNVVFYNKEAEANFFKGLLVKIDDNNEKIELENLKKQLNLLKEEIKNQEEIVKRKFDTYKRYQKLKTKSIEEKNMKFYDYINAKNQLINLKTQLSNLNANIKKLTDTINKKNIKVSGYISKIYVKTGDYVAPGSLIAEVDDITKQKLTLYVPINEIEKITNSSVIYINNKPSSFEVYKIWRVPDEKYVTSYKIELIGNGLKIGEIVNVEFK